MPTATEIIDMFANFQKAIGREVGELMGTMIDASTPRSLPATISANTQTVPASMPDMTAFESRIMASIDARLAAFEVRLQPVVGRKRSREPSPPTSDVEDTDIEDNEAGSGAVAAPFAPTKGQTTLTRFVQDGKAIADLVGAVKKLEMTGGDASLREAFGSGVPLELNRPTPCAPAPAPAPAPANMEESEEEETDSKGDAEEEEEEEAEEETDSKGDAEEEEEAEEEELTQITYKGKDYGMDGDGNIYGFDADGDLIEEPIGKMDEKTKKIAFF